MEIPKAWGAQRYVSSLRIGALVSTTEVTASNGGQKAGPVLDKMACLEKVHNGSQGGHKETRDPNTYIRKSKPGEICNRCPFTRSPSSSCIIAFPEMVEQLDLRTVMSRSLQPTGD